jgi:hypothetical protein
MKRRPIKSANVRWRPQTPNQFAYVSQTCQDGAAFCAAMQIVQQGMTVVSIKPENVAAWLNPNPEDLAAQYAILEDKVRPDYEHKLAA